MCQRNPKDIQLRLDEKIIYVGDDGYMILGTVSASTDLSNDELKQQYGLADTILRKIKLYVLDWDEIDCSS